jgi:hypothetical protein
MLPLGRIQSPASLPIAEADAASNRFFTRGGRPAPARLRPRPSPPVVTATDPGRAHQRLLPPTTVVVRTGSVFSLVTLRAAAILCDTLVGFGLGGGRTQGLGTRREEADWGDFYRSRFSLMLPFARTEKKPTGGTRCYCLWLTAPQTFGPRHHTLKRSSSGEKRKDTTDGWR